MAEVMSPELVRSGTFGSMWLNGEQMSECYGLQIKVSKTKESVPRCGATVEGNKFMSAKITGSVKLYNATSRLINTQAADLKAGKDTRFTIVSKLADPDNPDTQRIQVTGVSFDDLTLADWEAAKLGTIEAPFTADDFTVLEA
jgi:hypothetical protein